MTSKLRIKLGRVELEFEGSEEFIKQELMTVLTQVKTLSAAVDAVEESDSGGGSNMSGGSGTNLDGNLTTSTIAASLQASTGPDLVIAALAKLCMVTGSDKASRKQITIEMRSATAYFKETYVSNLTAALKTLITSKRVNDLGSGNYSLSATERTSLEKKLAGVG